MCFVCCRCRRWRRQWPAALGNLIISILDRRQLATGIASAPGEETPKKVCTCISRWYRYVSDEWMIFLYVVCVAGKEDGADKDLCWNTTVVKLPPPLPAAAAGAAKKVRACTHTIQLMHFYRWWIGNLFMHCVVGMSNFASILKISRLWRAL